MPRSAWVLSLVAAVTTSCNKSGSTNPGTDAAPGLDAPIGAPSASTTGADDCEKLRKNVVGEAAKLAACKTNDDCKVHHLSLCDFRELGCYSAHVNKSGDTAPLDRAVSEYSKTCPVTKCKCAMPNNAVCKGGACAGE